MNSVGKCYDRTHVLINVFEQKYDKERGKNRQRMEKYYAKIKRKAKLINIKAICDVNKILNIVIKLIKNYYDYYGNDDGWIQFSANAM